MKLKEKIVTWPHTSKVMMGLSLAAATVCAAGVYIDGPSWSSIWSAFFSGVNAAAAFYNMMLGRADKNHRKLMEVCTEQQAMLQAFIENRVQMHIEGQFMVEEPPPTVPRLH